MKKELVDGALVVGYGDVLANTLDGLPYLEVKRKDWKDDRHQWTVMVKRDMGRWLNRIKRYLGWDTVATIDIRPDGENDWVYFGDGRSPLHCLGRLPSFDAVGQYVGILEGHVDLDFDYNAKTRENLKQLGIVIASLLALAPFLYQAVQILPVSETIPSLEAVVEALPLFMGWTILGIAVSLLVWYNLEVLAGLREGKWWIFASYFKRVNKG